NRIHVRNVITILSARYLIKSETIYRPLRLQVRAGRMPANRRQGCRSSNATLQEKVMKKLYPFAIALFIFTLASLALAREAKLVRYPSYNNGRIAFTYQIGRASCRKHW